MKLGIIPARGGSKGIPRKNIYDIAGKPLIAYTIEAGLEAVEKGYLDELIVSTDDEEIAGVSRQYGANVPFLRPAEISNDKAKSVYCMIHAYDYYAKQGVYFDDIVLLQPTSPLRTGDDVISAIELYDNNTADSLVSCYKEESMSEYNSYYLEGDFGKALNKNHNKGMRRQDIPALYIRNGAIFITNVKYMLETELIIGDKPLLYVMPQNKSANIDTLFDMKQVQWMMENIKEY